MNLSFEPADKTSNTIVIRVNGRPFTTGTYDPQLGIDDRARLIALAIKDNIHRLEEDPEIMVNWGVNNTKTDPSNWEKFLRLLRYNLEILNVPRAELRDLRFHHR